MSTAPEPATILCVEDEFFLLEELEEELTSLGYRVLTASTTDEAEAILATEAPDVVLCDVMLPGRNGFEFLQEMRDQKKMKDHTAFIFLTALADREPHLRGLRAGADGYLTKPVDLDLLRLQLENTLRLVNRLREPEESLPEELQNVHLTPREEQVLLLLGEGERTGGIATRLSLSEHTVSQYIKELYRKLGINNRADAARLAISLQKASARKSGT